LITKQWTIDVNVILSILMYINVDVN